MTISRPSLIRLLAPVAVFAAVLVALVIANRAPAPATNSGTEAGTDTPALSGTTDQQIATLQGAVRAAPGRADGYALLGDAYLQKARETGDPAFYTRADRSYAASLARDPHNATAAVGAGTLANTRHDFRRGLRLGLEAHRRSPELVRPYTVIADAEIELGRYGPAGRTIQRLVDLKPTLASYARASYYRELHGDLRGAAEAMRLAASAGSGSPENVAYVQALVGDLELARGRVRSARDAYREALAAGSESPAAGARSSATGAPPAALGYPPALAGLARVAIAREDLPRAIRLLRTASDRLPLTSYLTLLAETELAAGRRVQAQRDLGVVRAQQQLLRAGGAVPDAELVVFEATHGSPHAAVALGRRVWRASPSVRSADALGWALTRAGRPAAGLAWSRRALRLGSRDPLFHLHAGLAARALGRTGQARRELRLTLRLNPGFSPWLARQARRALR